jgi:parvulin-like peptidyl-prolyl isomerase
MDEQTIKNKINKLLWRLNKKESFAGVAKDFNLVVKETGFFSQTDPIPGMGWSPQILNLISKLKIGEFSSPIYMDKYYYILRLKERKESTVADFETIKDKVKERFIKDKSQEMAKKKIADCLEKLKELRQTKSKSIDFDKVAKIYGLKSGSTNFFKYGSYIEGIGTSDNFFTAAQNLKEDDFSQVIAMGLAGFYIIKLKEKIPIEEKKFQEEKDEFTRRLVLQKKIEYFSKFLEELKRRLQIF